MRRREGAWRATNGVWMTCNPIAVSIHTATPGRVYKSSLATSGIHSHCHHYGHKGVRYAWPAHTKSPSSINNVFEMKYNGCIQMYGQGEMQIIDNRRDKKHACATSCHPILNYYYHPRVHLQRFRCNPDLDRDLSTFHVIFGHTSWSRQASRSQHFFKQTPIIWNQTP